MIRGSRLCSCNTGREDEVLLTYKLTSHQGDIRKRFCSPISGGTAPSFPRRGLWFLVPNMPTTPSTTLRSSSCSPALLSWFSLSILTDGAKFRSYRLATKSKVKKSLFYIFSEIFDLCEGGFRWGGKMQGRSLPASLYSIKYLQIETESEELTWQHGNMTWQLTWQGRTPPRRASRPDRCLLGTKPLGRKFMLTLFWILTFERTEFGRRESSRRSRT